MTDDSRRGHWEEVWSTRPPSETSWFQDQPQPSLSLILEHCPQRGAAADVGGGVSAIAPELVVAGFSPVTVVDIARSALDRAAAEWQNPSIDFVCADVRTWRPDRPVVLWHDRALLHFMVDDADLRAYVETVDAALTPGGVAVIATFAPDGPAACSGLEVRRHDGTSLTAAFGPGFELLAAVDHVHHTPWDAPQPFTFVVLRRH